MRSNDRYFLLIGICLAFLTLTIAYSIWSHPGSPPQLSTGDEVSGIVIHREGARIWLRLTTPDQVNNVSIGEIEAYRVQDKYAEDFDVGDLLKGKLLGNKTISHEPGVPFFEHDWDYGFVNSGDLLLFGGGGIKHDLSKPYPSLSFSIKNLGAKEVIAIRARINELDLPYTFGVSQDSPLEPSRGESFSCYTAWYSPGGGTGGYVPEDGEEYTVTVTVKFSDYSTRTFTKSGVYREEDNTGSICFMVSRSYVYFQPDLLLLGRGLGGSLSLSFRNEWSRTNQSIEELELYLEDTLVWGEPVSISRAKYFAVTVHIPFDPVPGKIYDVTLMAHSATGLNSTYTVPTLCQFIRIR